MTPLKPYLIRSVYDWLVDNELTPYLLVNAEINSNGNLPENFIKDGKIVLNIRPLAVEALSLGNELIEFNAKFNGNAMTVIVSVNAVIAIYAKEDQKKGLVFNQENSTEENTPPPNLTPPSGGKPTLRVVK